MAAKCIDAARGRRRSACPDRPPVDFAAMEYRKLGRSGLQVSEVSLGSWLTLGSSVDREARASSSSRAFDLGINLFDTADVYANGEAEEALGLRAPRHPAPLRGARHASASSRCPSTRTIADSRASTSSRASRARCDGCGTDYVDLLQCHRADPTTPIEETVRAFEDLIRQGKLLYWGVSEWQRGRRSSTPAASPTRAAPTGRSRTSPSTRSCAAASSAEVLPICAARGPRADRLQPARPGRAHRQVLAAASGPRAAAPRTRAQRVHGRVPRPTRCSRASIACGRSPTSSGISLAQLALAWCLRQPGVSSVIVGVTRAASSRTTRRRRAARCRARWSRRSTRCSRSRPARLPSRERPVA